MQWIDYVMVGGQMVASINRQTDTGTGLSTSFTRYFHFDHLGSIQTITDEAGALVERLAFDPWGKRRFADGTPDTANAITSSTDRGFTGHEHLEEVALVHMNGRVYDPVLGRFLSADPFVQDPYNSQAFNRYAYVGNNPLAFTDPSGYFSLGRIFRKIINFFLEPLSIIPGFDKFLAKHRWAQTLYMIVASANGGLPGAMKASAYLASVNGGSYGDMFKAAVITFVTAQAYDFVGSKTFGHLEDGLYGGVYTAKEYVRTGYFIANVAGHAVVGCASSAARGGGCKSGALAAGFGALAGPVLPTKSFELGLVKSAVAGGIGAKLGGGKFENGAVTGAFGYLYNKVALACRSVIGRLQHCGLFVYDGKNPKTARIKSQYSLGGFQTEFNRHSGTYNADLAAFRSGNNVYLISPPAGMSEHAYDAAVIDAANSYHAPTYRPISGPNSNSAAAYPVFKSGGNVPTIPNTPALQYWPAIDRLGLPY